MPAANEVARERVQHHIDAGALGRRHHLIGEGDRSGIHHLGHAKPPQHVAFRRGASGGEHLRPAALCELHGCETDAPCGSVDQHPLAGAQPGEAMQPITAVANATAIPAASSARISSGIGARNPAGTIASLPRGRGRIRTRDRRGEMQRRRYRPRRPFRHTRCRSGGYRPDTSAARSARRGSSARPPRPAGGLRPMPATRRVAGRKASPSKLPGWTSSKRNGRAFAQLGLARCRRTIRQQARHPAL